MGEENRKGAPEEPGAFQKVLGALNQGQKIRALEIARKHGIPDDDPVWHVVLTIAEAEEGIKEVAQSLRSASVAVTAATSAEVKASRDKAKIEIDKMQEDVKAKVADALSKTLETEIREAVSRLQSQSNRPLHKKWLIAMGVGILIAAGLGGWGVRDFSKYEERVGEAKISAFMGSADFPNLMQCNNPGWITRWVGAGKEKKLACYPSADKKSGKLFGWQIP